MDAGTRVYDNEDEFPDDAVVVRRPDEMTITDWEYEADGETYTTAESNPDYPEDEQLVVIAFEAELDEHWPDWRETEDEALAEGVEAHGISTYGFPEGRLTVIEESDDSDDDTDEAAESEPEPPAEFDVLEERFEENGFDVRVEGPQLHVEKYGDAYVVEADGTVEGEGGLRNRVTSIAGRYL